MTEESLRPTQDERLLARSYQGLLGLLSISSLETLIWALAFGMEKSEPDSQVFLGLSTIRLGIVVFLLLSAIVFSLGIVNLLREKESAQKGIHNFSQQERRFNSLVLLCASTFIILVILLTFRPDSWGRHFEYFIQLRAILGWGALISAQISLYLLIFDPLSRFRLTRKQVVFVCLGVCMVSVWFYSSQSMAGRPATLWMGYFQVEEFYPTTPQELIAFFKEMRAGIPPALSLAEIITGKFTGASLIITQEFYRLSLIIAYLIAAYLYAETIIKGVITSLVALVSMSATIIISAQNPEIYDLYYPCYLLLFLLFVKLASSRNKYDHLKVWWAFLGGVFLALAELSRPFVLLLMPFIIFFVILVFRTASRRILVSFLVPVIILSGGWHLKLLVFNQGQVFWSNHSGFNLYRAWEEVADIPEPPAEPQTWDRRNQIHSQEHYLNSQKIQRAVLNFIVENPGEAFSFMITRLRIFLQPRTSFFEHPELGGVLIQVYRIIFRLCLVYWGIQLLRMGFNIFKNPGLHLFSNPENVLLITTTLTVIILAISEKGEEARLVLAVLPLIGALPSYKGDGQFKNN